VIRENIEQRNTEQNVSGARLSNNRFVFCPVFVCFPIRGSRRNVPQPEKASRGDGIAVG
jgi:hypothetical protein